MTQVTDKTVTDTCQSDGTGEQAAYSSKGFSKLGTFCYPTDLTVGNLKSLLSSLSSNMEDSVKNSKFNTKFA